MWGIYLFELEKIVQDYDHSWQKKFGKFYQEHPAVNKIREFLQKNQEEILFAEMSYTDFIFLSSLLVPPCRHALLVALRQRLNQDGLLDAAEKLAELGLANEKNLTRMGGLLLPEIKIFHTLLIDLSAQRIAMTSSVIELICQFLSNPHCLTLIKSCLLLLTQYQLADADTLTLLVLRSDDFTFICKGIHALERIQNGKWFTRASLDLILDGNNSIMFSSLLPLFEKADFFNDEVLALLGSHLFQAWRVRDTIRFLLTNDCLDKTILAKIIKSDAGLAHHVEFVASLLKGSDLLNRRQVRKIFLLADDYYLRSGLAKIAEENLLNAYVFQLIASSRDCQERIISLTRQGEVSREMLSAALNVDNIIVKRSHSQDDLRFFKQGHDLLAADQARALKRNSRPS